MEHQSENDGRPPAAKRRWPQNGGGDSLEHPLEGGSPENQDEHHQYVEPIEYENAMPRVTRGRSRHDLAASSASPPAAAVTPRRTGS